MKRYDECSKFVQSIALTSVAIIATSVGTVVAGAYVWVNVWLRMRPHKRNIPALETFALGFESLLICGAATVLVAAKVYNQIDALQNESSIRNSGLEFAVVIRMLAGVALVVMCSAELTSVRDLHVGMIARLLAIFVIFAPLDANGGSWCDR